MNRFFCIIFLPFILLACVPPMLCFTNNSSTDFTAEFTGISDVMSHFYDYFHYICVKMLLQTHVCTSLHLKINYTHLLMKAYTCSVWYKLFSSVENLISPPENIVADAVQKYIFAVAVIQMSNVSTVKSVFSLRTYWYLQICFSTQSPFQCWICLKVGMQLGQFESAYTSVIILIWKET